MVRGERISKGEVDAETPRPRERIDALPPPYGRSVMVGGLR
jgi:hypothetical protein